MEKKDDDKVGEYHQIPRPLTPKNEPRRYDHPKPVIIPPFTPLPKEDIELISSMIKARMNGSISDEAYQDFLRSLRTTRLAKK